MKPLFIMGSSGHAHDLADIAEAAKLRPIFVSNDHNEIANWTGHDEIIEERIAISYPKELFVIGIGDNANRARLAETYWQKLNFTNLVHPDASFGRGQRAILDTRRGNILFSGARLTHGIKLGDFGTFNLNSTVSHDCKIGNFVNLSPGANVAGNVAIGNGVWIGIGAAINQGSSQKMRVLGDWSTIGSGAVVTKDCLSNATYVGIPARIL